MTLNEALTFIGLFTSPIVAVGITLWIEGRRRDREGKMVIVRALLATRHMPSDPNYSTAINLIRAEFANCPAVMIAFKEYHQTISKEPSTTPEGIAREATELGRVQTKLISAVLGAVGINSSEADLATDAYAARAFIERDNLYLRSLAAQERIASALEASVQQNAAFLSVRAS